MNETKWETTKALPSLGYTCGFCNKEIASQKGYEGESRCDGEEMGGPPESYTSYTLYIYICPHCDRPSLIDTEIGAYTESFIASQFPKPKTNHSKVIEGLTDEVKNAYDEANKCFATGAWTATAMLCRKILMNIAVSKGNKEKNTFMEHVEYLYQERHLNNELKEWAEKVRNVGNEANHKIEKISKNQAKDIFQFIHFLLTIIYELPYRAKKGKPHQPTTIKPTAPKNNKK